MSEPTVETRTWVNFSPGVPGGNTTSGKYPLEINPGTGEVNITQNKPGYIVRGNGGSTPSQVDTLAPPVTNGNRKPQTLRARGAKLGAGVAGWAYWAVTTSGFTFDPPCPELTDVEFFEALDTSKQDVKDALNRAQAIDEITEFNNNLCMASIAATAVTAVVGLLVPGIGQAATIGVGQFASVACTGSALFNFAASGVKAIERNNAIHVARDNMLASPQNAGIPGAQCPIPSDKGKPKTLQDCCGSSVVVNIEVKELEFDSLVRVIVISPTLPIKAAYIYVNGRRNRIGPFTQDSPISAYSDFIVNENNGLVLRSENKYQAVVITEDSAFSAVWEKPQAEAIASIPLEWDIKIGNSRPQLIINFAEELPNGQLSAAKYQISIPHAQTATPLQVSPISKYKKGNIRGQAELKDNSKIIVFAETEAECLRVIAQAIALIPTPMLTGLDPICARVDPTGRRRFEKAVLVPKIMRYYPDGQKTLMPEWERRL